MAKKKSDESDDFKWRKRKQTAPKKKQPILKKEQFHQMLKKWSKHPTKIKV